MNPIMFLGLELIDLKIAISDVILAIACFWCWRSLRYHTLQISEIIYIKSWRRFFFFMAFSFLLGGFAHALELYIKNALHFLAWYSSFLGLFYFQWGMAHLSQYNIKQRLFLIGMLAVCGVLSVVLASFLVIVIYSFVAFFFVLRVNTYVKIFGFRIPSSRQILYGAGLFLLAGIGFLTGFRVLFFDTGTLSHILITIGMILFGKGCIKVIEGFSGKQESGLLDSDLSSFDRL